MKVLVTGAQGQLGYELQRHYPEQLNLIATDQDTLDITDAAQIKAAFDRHQPDAVINAAAYTAVDKAESDQAAAWVLNAAAPRLLAQACQQQKRRLIQISTDFVFDGQQSTPYLPDALCKPLSEYGKSKYAGEQAVREHLPDALIIRTSWLHSAHGGNFVKSMLRLMRERGQLGIVYDQVGSPTWAHTLAHCIWVLLEKNAQGICHCTDNGVASWYDFALAVQQIALSLGLLEKAIPIKPIRSSAYPTPAQRPAYSVMDKVVTETWLGASLPHWRDSLHNMLAELKPMENPEPTPS